VLDGLLNPANNGQSVGLRMVLWNADSGQQNYLYRIQKHVSSEGNCLVSGKKVLVDIKVFYFAPTFQSKIVSIFYFQCFISKYFSKE